MVAVVVSVVVVVVSSLEDLLAHPMDVGLLVGFMQALLMAVPRIPSMASLLATEIPAMEGVLGAGLGCSWGAFTPCFLMP